MSHTVSDNYLITAVTTAPPQKLQLMLIDAAIQSVRGAQMHWQEKEIDLAKKCILRAARIVRGILTGMDYNDKSELVGKVAAVYLYVHDALTRASAENYPHKLADALRVLEVERETWRQLCEKLALVSGVELVGQAGRYAPAPHFAANEEFALDGPAASFSLEA
jgi:flagellar secretion chaperone FliS